MKLIVVTSPTFFVEEDKIITALFEEGLDVLHIRKPDTQVVYLERLLRLIPEKFHNKIVIHQHFQVKKEYGLMGIHLSKHYPNEPKEYKGHKSRSCHSLSDVKDQKPLHNYVFMSPVFENICDVHYDVYTPEELRIAQKQKIIDSKVMALGGINADNIITIKDMGFGGAVVLNDIWSHFDECSDRDFIGVINHFKELKDLAD